MRIRTFTMTSALLGLLLLPSADALAQSGWTLTTKRGGTIEKARTNTEDEAAVTTTVTTAGGRTGSKSRSWNSETHTATRSVTGPDGKTASAVTTIDANRDDEHVGVQRVLTGPNGRTANASRSTYRDGEGIVHESTWTDFQGRSGSRRGVFTDEGRSHTRTNRLGRTRTWSRHR